MNKLNVFSSIAFLISVVLYWYFLSVAIIIVRLMYWDRSWKHDLFHLLKFLKRFTHCEPTPSWNYIAPAGSANTDVCLLVMRHLNDPRTARLVCKKMSQDVVLMRQWYHDRAVHIAHYCKYWSPVIHILPDARLMCETVKHDALMQGSTLRFETFAKSDKVWTCFHLEPAHLVHLPEAVRNSNDSLLKLVAFTRHEIYLQSVERGLFQ